MKAKAFALAGLAGSVVLAGTASAAFVNVTVEEFVGDGWMENGYGATGLTTFRMYANFTGEDGDGVLSVFGLPGNTLSLNSSTGYNNDPLGGLTAPLDITPAIWSNQWDTYVTIGTTTSTGDVTTLSPGFESITGGLGQNWTIDNGGWFVTPVDEQAQADANNQVLLAQVAAPAGAGTPEVFGTMSLLLLNSTEVNGIAFSSIPAPGALALLGLAGLAGTRRRRA